MKWGERRGEIAQNDLLDDLFEGQAKHNLDALDAKCKKLGFVVYRVVTSKISKKEEWLKSGKKNIIYRQKIVVKGFFDNNNCDCIFWNQPHDN